MNATMSPEKLKHFPVMLEKILSIITPQHGGVFIDCTFGAGGYSKSILNFKNTKVIALDRDSIAKKEAELFLKKYKKRFVFFNKKFSDIHKIPIKEDSADSIILDLGFSSMQMKDLDRGFSFNATGTLDMKMGLNNFGANEVINYLEQKEIELILKYFGEEKNFRKIAFELINLRNKKKINTKDLVDIVNKVKIKKFYNKTNPSTKTFQAIRIFVNNEISELINGLINATKILKPGGKLVVVTFHSLEDRIVKFFFKNYSENKNPSRYVPELTKEDKTLFDLPQRKVLIPSEEELKQNYPSRSAKLRYVIRNNNKFTYPKDLIVKFQKYLDIENISLKI